ncbi:KH domain-containing At4g18375 [Olea europaea subsp. europaea]|uniref:KH domain-containing At4g18375 n=1 Tax=Olea europaea subsp. europaea TaxID=158383 RepID=A0A8S0PA87_OLEEU|nr:KH domain-containing At4g18375 [Olea europaea subsp. europaea]
MKAKNGGKFPNHEKISVAADQVSHHNDGDIKNLERHLDRERDKDDKGNDELMGYRILCPDGVIGNVIGKSGNVIKSIRQETRAKAKVLASLPGARDKSCHNLLLC